MELKKMLSAVRNDQIEFLTMRPPGSQFAILDRRVVVTAPKELVELSRTGKLDVLDRLVKMLMDRDKAWAAMVLLAAMTREDEKLVEAYATRPDKWWDLYGEKASESWSKWWHDKRPKLKWDEKDKAFVEGP